MSVLLVHGTDDVWMVNVIFAQAVRYTMFEGSNYLHIFSLALLGDGDGDGDDDDENQPFPLAVVPLSGH